MRKFPFVKFFFGLILVACVFYLLVTYAGMAKDVFDSFLPGGSVKGTSTRKAEKISSKINADIEAQMESAQEQLLNIRIGDVVDGFSRLQKIPRDVESVKEYGREQVENILPHKKEKTAH